jgi:hypothetical protein
MNDWEKLFMAVNDRYNMLSIAFHEKSVMRFSKEMAISHMLAVACFA